MNHVIASILAIAVISPAYASLDWPQRETQVETRANRPAVEATFPFTNTGDTPVTITSVYTGCGCTVAVPDQDTYAPGESGVITATYEAEGKPGTATKHITVRTDDPDQPVLTLRLKVTEPEVIKLSEKMLLWKEGERQSKTLRLEVIQDDPLPKLTARCAKPGVTLKLTPVEEGGRLYDLTVTPPPPGDGKPFRGRLTLHADDKDTTPAFRVISLQASAAAE